MIITVPDMELSDRFPQSMPLVNLYDAAAIGLYGLKSADDESGYGKTLITSNAFDSEGMVTALATTAKAVTGVMEPDEFTAIVSYNLAAPASGGNILSNMSPTAAPMTGLSLIIKNDGKAYIRVASGSASPSFTEHDVGAASGGWTCFAIRVKAGEISSMRKAGAVTTTALAHAKAKGTIESFVLNGSPINSPTTGGLVGKIGLVCMYNKYFDNAKTKLLIDAAVAYMATKGVST